MSGNYRQLRIKANHETGDYDGDISTTTFSTIDSLQTGLLTIPSFSDAEDFGNFLHGVFQRVNQETIENLIIDIRNNEGGRDDYGCLLFSYLANEPFKYYERLSVATADTSLLARLTFGESPFNTALPDYLSNVEVQNGSYAYVTHSNLGLHRQNELSFKGSVYILVNGGTFSTAAEFASIAHANGRALFIGEETGGGYYGNCSLGSPTLKLPHSQISVSIPLARYELAVSNTVQVGRGLVPEVQIDPSSQDLLFSRDKALEHCISIIARNRQ